VPVGVTHTTFTFPLCVSTLSMLLECLCGAGGFFGGRCVCRSLSGQVWCVHVFVTITIVATTPLPVWLLLVTIALVGMSFFPVTMQ